MIPKSYMPEAGCSAPVFDPDNPWWDLKGHECRVEFDLEPSLWPIPGFPAWVILEDVQMPLVRMRSKWAGKPFWINAKFIKTMESVDEQNPQVSGPTPGGNHEEN